MGNTQTSAGMAAVGAAVATILVWAGELALGAYTATNDIPQGIESAVTVILVFLFTRLMPASVPETFGQPPPTSVWAAWLLPLALLAGCTTLGVRVPVSDYAAFDQAQVAYTNVAEWAVDDLMPSRVCDKRCDEVVVAIMEESNPAIDEADPIAAKYKCHAEGPPPCDPILGTDKFVLETGLAVAKRARARLRSYALSKGVEPKE